MNRRATDRLGRPGASTADAFSNEQGAPLRALGWSEFDQTEHWPENFIVRPDPPRTGPPSGVALPVLTVPAEGFDSSDGSSGADPGAQTEPATLFAPTAFDARLRRVDVEGLEDEEYSRFHADPDSAPAALGEPRSAFASPNFWWLVLLALLGLAAVAWLWLPSLHQGG